MDRTPHAGVRRNDARFDSPTARTPAWPWLHSMWLLPLLVHPALWHALALPGLALAQAHVDAGAAEPDGGKAGEAPDAGAPREVAELSPPVWLSPSAAPWPAQHAVDGPDAVHVLVTLDTAGAVTSVELGDNASALSPALADAALNFAREQRFAPAMRAGVPVPAKVGLLITFEAPPPSAVPDVPIQAPAEPAGPTTISSSESPSKPAPTDAAPNAKSSETAQPAAYGARAHIEAAISKVPETSASDLRLEVGALREVPRPDAMHLVTLAPGMVLTNHAGEGHAHSVFLRGFAAGEGQDLEVRVAGIPINEPSNAHGHGYADTSFVIPELVHALRVQQGPFDTRQGDFAAAGSVEFALLAPHSGARAQLGLGSYGRRRALVLWSPEAASRQTFAAIDLEEGRGFGAHRAHGKVRALGQFAGRFKRAHYRVLGASHALRFDSAGVTRVDAVRDDGSRCATADSAPFFCVLDPHQGGYASRHLVSVRLGDRRPRADWSEQLTFMLRETRFRENFTGALLDSRGDGVERKTHTTTLTLRGHYRVLSTWRDRPQTFELGYEGRYDASESSSARVRTDGHTPYARMFDYDLSLTRISLYVLGELTLLERLRAHLGARAVTFGYGVTDRARDTRDRDGVRLPEQSVSAWGTNYQPRASLSVGPYRGLTWINSFGLGSRSSDAAALSDGERAPFSRIWAGESGVLSELALGPLRAQTRAVGFYTHVDRDAIFDEVRGRNVPVGATNRYGASAHMRVSLPELLDAVTSFTWTEAYAPSDGSSPGFAGGSRVPYVPRFVFRADAVGFRSLPVRSGAVRLGSAVGVTWIGPRPLPLNTLSSAIFTLDASVRVQYRFVECALSAQNLTDRRNTSAEFFYASDFGTGGVSMRRVRHASAAPPRQFLLTVAVVWDPVDRTKEKP
jgi:iron complex outermembrane receptor protein